MLMVDEPLSASSPLDDEAYEWVKRFAGPGGRRADVAALKEWMARSAAHAEAFDRVSRTWVSLELVSEKLMARELVYSESLHRAWQGEPVRPTLGRRVLLGGGLAASVAGIAVIAVRPPLELWPSLSELTADFRTSAGEQRELMLAGRVLIDLNTRTSLAVGSAYASEARLVAGEALISSPPQVAFTLVAGDGRVVASGARFNARIEDRGVCITCMSGDVLVKQGTSTMPLPAGQQLVYSNRGMERPVTIDPATVASWHDGVVLFESTPVTDVITEVNRYRPGKIILTNRELGRRLFDARLRIENIGNVVRQIELAFGAHATELLGGIVLLG
jgi:transmembrane sensor